MGEAMIGFVGLGNMGAPMAANLVAEGHSLTVYDIAGTESRAPKHSKIASDLENLVETCELVLLSLPDRTAVIEVAERISGVSNCAVQAVADHSTIGVEAARLAHGILENVDIQFLDAPVSGGTLGAKQGTLALMASGNEKLFHELDPILASFAKNRFYIGVEPGQGQAMKLLNNFLSATAMTATSEAVAFGESLGLNSKTMIDVFNVSSGQNTATSDKFPRRILTRKFDAGFTIDLLTKDVSLYLKEMEKNTNQDIMAKTVCGILQEMLAAMPGADFTEIYTFIKRQSKRP